MRPMGDEQYETSPQQERHQDTTRNPGTRSPPARCARDREAASPAVLALGAVHLVKAPRHVPPVQRGAERTEIDQKEAPVLGSRRIRMCSRDTSYELTMRTSTGKAIPPRPTVTNPSRCRGGAGRRCLRRRDRAQDGAASPAAELDDLLSRGDVRPGVHRGDPSRPFADASSGPAGATTPSRPECPLQSISPSGSARNSTCQSIPAFWTGDGSPPRSRSA